MLFLKSEGLKIETTPWPICYRMDVVLAGMNTTLILHISIRALGWPGALSMSSNIWKESLFLSSDLISTLGFDQGIYKNIFCYSSENIEVHWWLQKGSRTCLHPCYRLNACVSFIGWNLMPSIIVSGGGAFGRSLGFDSGALINGIGTLLKDIPES